MKQKISFLIMLASASICGFIGLNQTQSDNSTSLLTIENIEALTSKNEDGNGYASKIKDTWEETVYENPYDPNDKRTATFYKIDCEGEGVIDCTPDFGII